MAYDYGKAFALRDNPFGPLEPVKGVVRKTLQNGLAANPLLLNLEPALEKLYSPEAGPFLTYLDNFQKFARKKGYRDKPPKTGTASFIFSIYGYEGTGKTTMAQVIIKWLRECKPTEGDWSVHDEWALKKPARPADHIKQIDDLQSLITARVSPNSYCCIVVDDLAAEDVLERALDMYDQLTNPATSALLVFLFLLSNDRELFPALSNNGKRQITPFRMRPLSADSAVEFVKCRIGAFRDKTVDPPWLKLYPLFPFNEDDIRNAFDTNAVLNYVPEDTVSLRQFSMLLDSMIADRLERLDDDFDVMQIPEAQISKHLLWISDEYKKLVENTKLVVNG